MQEEDNPSSKKGDTGVSHPQSRPKSFFEALANSAHDAAGNLTNQVVGAITHVDLAQKFSQPINSALAGQYIKGRDILQQRQAQGKGADDLSGLKSDEIDAVRSYQKVHNELPAKIPYIDRDALVREVERNIEAKASGQRQPARPNEKSSELPRRTDTGEAADDSQTHTSGQHLTGQSALREGPNKSSNVPVKTDTTAKGNFSGAPGDSSARTAAPQSQRDNQPRSAAAKSETVSTDRSDRDHGAVGGRASDAASRLPSKEQADRSGNMGDKSSADSGRQAGTSDREPAPTRPSPPKPYEPQTRELKERNSGVEGGAGESSSPQARTANNTASYPAAGSGSRIRDISLTSGVELGQTQRNVPPPNMPARLESGSGRSTDNTTHGFAGSENAVKEATKLLPLKFAMLLNQDLQNQPSIKPGSQTFISRADAGPRQPDGAATTRDGVARMSVPASDKCSPVFNPNLSDMVAKLAFVVERKLAMQATGLGPRNAPSEGNLGRIQATDSRAFHLMVSQQAVPLGRSFGQTEKIISLSHGDNHTSTTAGGKTGISPHAEQAHGLDSSSHNFSQGGASHAPGLHPSNIGHGLDQGHRDSAHISIRGGEISADHGDHQGNDQGAHQVLDHGAAHLIEQGAHINDHGASHSAGHSSDSGHLVSANTETGALIGNMSPRTPVVVDTKGAEVSPFGKDKDDFDESLDQPELKEGGRKGGPCATYVVKGLIPDKRYITGGELAFVAIMALASAARVRPGENATEFGLNQVRREYVLVEEDPWFNADYVLDENIDKKKRVKSEKGTSAVDKVTSATDEDTSVSTAKTSSEVPARRVLLRPQILVQEDDDLGDMAEALFNDRRLAHLIADINAKTIEEIYIQDKRVIKLSTRQRLSLPVHQDRVQYEKSSLWAGSAGPLVTIVESTAIDRELLDEGLSSMLGISSQNKDPLEKQANE
jgi:hypothetical protein